MSERGTTRVLGTLGWDDSDRERQSPLSLSLIEFAPRVASIFPPSLPHSLTSIVGSLARCSLWPSIEPANEEQRFLALFLGVRCALRSCTAFSA